MLHRDAGAEALALLRIAVFGMWFVAIAGVSPLSVAGELPRELFEAPGVLALLPDAFWDAFLQPGALALFNGAVLLLVAVAALGAGPFRVIAPLAFIGVLLVDGMQKGFSGYPNHAQFGLLYATLFVAVSPAADALRPGRWLVREGGGPAPRYRFPLVATALTLSISYFLIAGYRLAISGIEPFTGDALPRYLALRTLDYAPSQFEVSVLLLRSATMVALLKVGFAVTTLFELLSPLALLRRGFRLAWLAVIVPFHFATLLTMNIFFWENLVLLALVFTSLPERVQEWADGRGRRTEMGSPRDHPARAGSGLSRTPQRG